MYIENIEQTRAKRLTQEELERENKNLRDRLRGLESAHAASTESQLQVDGLRHDLESERLARKRLVRVTLIASVFTIAVIVATIGLLVRFHG